MKNPYSTLLIFNFTFSAGHLIYATTCFNKLDANFENDQHDLHPRNLQYTKVYIKLNKVFKERNLGWLVLTKTLTFNNIVNHT